MINTISDLLNEFLIAETDILNKQQIKHPTTIGTMFEGLTESILTKAIFKDLKLRIVKNSFIKGCDTEFDVLLVDGEGEKIPYTDRYKFPAEKVIAIIQVKKNLFSKDIKDAYSNLKYLVDYYDTEKLEDYKFRLLRDGFRSITRKDLSIIKNKNYTIQEEGIYYSLISEVVLPVRIVWGYNGFKSEYNLRESFVDYLGQNVTHDIKNIKHGFGPQNFPNLIICGQFSLNKVNGNPFGYPVDKDNWWSFYASSSYNPVYFLLETIWTRLSYKYKFLPIDIFGDDLSIEPVKLYIDCRVNEFNRDLLGWEYNYRGFNEESLKEISNPVEWTPTFLDKEQYVIIQELCKNSSINLKEDKDLEKFVIKDGNYNSLNDFIKRLKETGLVFTENNQLKLLTDNCQCVFLPDGRTIAGENKSGRLTKWVTKFIKDRKSSS
ncbi:DUF6602 domain-containing protein [uncultured Psychroserpens sp.]|uniref:DUF6602 domain-containing protein n=1 Tax=uncultured Psychroserpens sp. TaxID=255436 RepID=UPI00262C1834|nr:DUF6602 domain-containing protein [uncultured Psychroserpens sp.]